MKNHLLAVAAFSLSMGVFAGKPEISSGSYYAGGAVGTLIGYGIGHAIQGRYKEMGWIFTVGEGAGLIVLSGGLAWMVNSVPENTKWKNSKLSDSSKGSIALAAIGTAVLVGFRIWEIVDVWLGATPVDTAAKHARFLNKDEGRFAGATELGVAAFNVPLLTYNF
jgi:hypothetical protein